MSERYRLVRLLGGGGMAEVYLGKALGAEGFEKPVAIKRVLPHLSREETVAKMFVAEAKLSMHLHHQNIVEVFDVGRSDEGLFLVMELVNGWDLATVLEAAQKKGLAFSAPLAAYVLEQVVAGLRHAFKKTVNGKPLMSAHRDLSPSNVMVTVDGEVKVCDFGIARVESLSAGTEPGTFKGKIAYSAPEVIRGGAANWLSDEFSLGVVLHELLTARHPFGFLDNLVAYHQLLQNAPPLQLEQLPAALAELVQRLLAMDPAQRYPTIDDVGRALSAYTARSGTPVSAAELASFLAQLELPKPPLELMDQPIPLTDRAPGLESTAIRQLGGKPLLTSSPVSITLEHESEWQLPISGRVLDESGKLVSAGRSAAPTEPALELARAPRQGAPSPGAPLPDVPLELQRATQQPSGLELAGDGEDWRTRNGEYAPVADQGRSFTFPVGKAIAVAVVLAAAAVGAAMFAPMLGLEGLMRSSGVRNLIPMAVKPVAPQVPMLYVDSDPDGATVEIEGSVVGQTPLVLENQYPSRELEIVVTKKGRSAWVSRFKGGEKVHLEAKLDAKARR